MKIALVHDYLKEYGGAEKVLETLADIFPQAHIYTSIYHPSSLGPHRSRLEAKWSGRVHQSIFRFIPFAHKLISPLRLLSPLAFWFFDFSDYDLIITSATGAYFPNCLRKGQAKLVCYCHTPPRYLYHLATARPLPQNPITKSLLLIIFHFLRLIDYHSAQNVDQFIANSRTTSARIRKYYRRDSLVINPPVDTPKSPLSSKVEKKGNFFLTGGRLAHAKRHDIAIAACTQINLPLKVFGRDFANNITYLRSIAGPTIEFIGEVDNTTKFQLMSQARGFIFPSDNEDFGIVPVEAMALGCPVIAFKSGGATETVVEGKTGLFFDDLTPDSCAAALKRFQKFKFSPISCRLHARQFNQSNFIRKIKKITNTRT